MSLLGATSNVESWPPDRSFTTHIVGDLTSPGIQEKRYLQFASGPPEQEMYSR